MKQLAIFPFLLLLVFVSTAQLPPNSIYLGNNVYGNKNNAATQGSVWHNGDPNTNLMTYDQAIRQCASGTHNKTTSTSTYDDVLTAGNVSALDAIHDNGAVSTFVRPGEVSLYIDGAGFANALISANGFIALFDPTHTAYGSIHSGVLTGGADLYIPNESGNIVVHTSKTDDTVTNGLSSAWLTVNGVYINSVDKQAEISITSYPHVLLGDASSVWTAQYKTGPLTHNRLYLGPDETGTMLLNDGGTNTQTFAAPTTTMIVPISFGFIPRRVIPIFTTVLPSGITWFVTSKTITNFTITFSAAVSGTIEVDYQAFK